MLRIRDYVRAESLEQAYELNQKRSTRILGGMLWLKMGNQTVQTAVDLSGLGLDTIEENGEEFSIGCMVTLRQLELHKGLETYTMGAVRESVRGIVGVQFRNVATVGGSIFGRFGFSDVLTCFLALDSYVELYQGGIMSLRQFAGAKRDQDILVRLIVKKKPGACVYLSHRNTCTDFPVLTCALFAGEKDGCAVLGARPGRAVCIPFSREDMELYKSSEAREAMAEKLAGKVSMGSNMRAGREYRTHLAKVLLRRGLEALTEGGDDR